MAFAQRWDKQYPTISKSWLNHWERIIPFFAFPPELRKAIYTTNATTPCGYLQSSVNR